MSYLKINYDDSKPVYEELELPEDPKEWLDACYNVLECNTIEVVPTVLPGIYLVIDENGKLWDGWQNRINKVASIIYGSKWDLIAGKAILARGYGENLYPLASSDVDRLRRYFPYTF